jgi:PAS domain-containing protein
MTRRLYKRFAEPGFVIATFIPATAIAIFLAAWNLVNEQFAYDRPTYLLMDLGGAIIVAGATAWFSRLLWARRIDLANRELRANEKKYRARVEITEARYAEKSEVLEFTLAHMNQGIAMVNPEGQVLMFNPRGVEYSGIDETQFSLPANVKDIFAAQWESGEFGKTGELLPPDVRKFFLTGEGKLPAKYVRRRPNGAFIEARTEFLPSGYMVQSYTDITELVQAKEAAEAAARAKSTFLATMSHEIRHGRGAGARRTVARTARMRRRHCQLRRRPARRHQRHSRFLEIRFQRRDAGGRAPRSRQTRPRRPQRRRRRRPRQGFACSLRNRR